MHSHRQIRTSVFTCCVIADLSVAAEGLPAQPSAAERRRQQAMVRLQRDLRDAEQRAEQAEQSHAMTAETSDESSASSRRRRWPWPTYAPSWTVPNRLATGSSATMSGRRPPTRKPQSAIAVNDFVSLADPQGLAESDAVDSLVSRIAAPTVTAALDAVSGQLTTTNLKAMVTRVEVDKDDTAAVAADFLTAHGLA